MGVLDVEVRLRGVLLYIRKAEEVVKTILHAGLVPLRSEVGVFA